MAPGLLCIIYKSVSLFKDQTQKKKDNLNYQIKQINNTWLVDWKDAYMMLEEFQVLNVKH